MWVVGVEFQGAYGYECLAFWVFGFGFWVLGVDQSPRRSERSESDHEAQAAKVLFLGTTNLWSVFESGMLWNLGRLQASNVGSSYTPWVLEIYTQRAPYGYLSKHMHLDDHGCRSALSMLIIHTRPKPYPKANDPRSIIGEE